MGRGGVPAGWSPWYYLSPQLKRLDAVSQCFGGKPPSMGNGMHSECAPRTQIPSWRSWSLSRIGVPLGVALVSVATLWGRESLAAIFLSPILVLVWNMFLASTERSAHERRGRERKADALVRNWHALNLLALFILMFFEGAVAAFAQDKNTALFKWLCTLAFLFLPYLLVSAWAHTYLRRMRTS